MQQRLSSLARAYTGCYRDMRLRPCPLDFAKESFGRNIVFVSLAMALVTIGLVVTRPGLLYIVPELAVSLALAQGLAGRLYYQTLAYRAAQIEIAAILTGE